MARYFSFLAIILAVTFAVVPAEAKGPKGKGGPKGNNGNHYGWYKGGGPSNVYRSYYQPYVAPYAYPPVVNPHYSSYPAYAPGYAPWPGYYWYDY
jgi:hypothetical protein